ncbi:MAG: cyclopropane-fatty-acyl-phospholipid synthase [Bacteroidetes bacterium GWA2_40_15]|nr:MAG: cyclopropane-fatty-acyl-phospholipid synthase [Bacteroidetes bacterium GWA2_40_15]
MNKKCKKITEEILELAGVKINGSNPWDIQIHNEEFYRRAITEGELGIGESYMDGWWDAGKVDELIYKILTAQLDKKIRRNFPILFRFFTTQIFNLQSKRRAFIIGEKHYDLGNELFQHMLDKRMNYSCAYWKDADSLDEAQDNKLELICRKLYLEPGMRVLDIGCGWGAFGKYSAEKYNVEVVGITVSKEQVELGRKLCKGLPVEIRLMDYRDVNEKYDRIVSVGMIEHVGYKNYKTFFKVANKCLNDEGLFLLQTIGSIKSVKTHNLWTNKYIFPNGMLPSMAQLSKAIENLFVMEDWHNFGIDYDKTLMEWFNNFVTNWDKIKNKYSERFFRMWKYFLLSSAGSFRSRRHDQLWQIVLSKNGIPGGYQSIR